MWGGGVVYAHTHTHTLSILYTYINNCSHVHVGHSTRRGPVWLLGGGCGTAVAVICAVRTHPPLFDFRGGENREKRERRPLTRHLGTPCVCMCVRARLYNRFLCFDSIPFVGPLLRLSLCIPRRHLKGRNEIFFRQTEVWLGRVAFFVLQCRLILFLYNPFS